MNYLAEIKAFYDLVQVKQFSTGQIALWHALMAINNKCAWIEWFTVPNISLELNTGMSRSGILKARNSLKQSGLIDFKQNGTRATSYKMNTIAKSKQESVQDESTMLKSKQDSTRDSKQVSKQVGVQDSKQVSNTLNKLNETKLNESSSINYYMQNINPLISPHEAELLISYNEELSDEIVIYAIQEAIEHNAKNMKYIKAILDRYITQGLSSIEQIKAQNDFNAQKNKKQETLEEETKRLRKEWGLSDEV